MNGHGCPSTLITAVTLIAAPLMTAGGLEAAITLFQGSMLREMPTPSRESTINASPAWSIRVTVEDAVANRGRSGARIEFSK